MKHRKVLFLALVVFYASSMMFNLKGGDAYYNTDDNIDAGVVLQAITRYSSYMYGAFESAFLALNPAVDDIIWLEISNPSQWVTAIASPSYSIDIIWGGVQGNFDVVADAGYLVPIENQTLTNYINTNVTNDIEGVQTIRTNESGSILWVGSCLSSYGFLVNHDSLTSNNLSLPQTWEDLASPEYFLDSDQFALGMANAPESISSTYIYHSILQNYGWESGWNLITRMAGNAEIHDYTSAVRDSLIAGEHAIGLTIDSFGYQAEFMNPSCEYIIPTGGSLITVEPIAVASSASGEERVQAEAFIDFVLSPEGQALWLDNVFDRIPVVEDAFSLSLQINGYERQDLYEDYIKLHNITGITFDFDLARSVYDIVTFYFEGALTLSSQELHYAWEELVTTYRNAELTENEFNYISSLMSKPKISLQEALNLQIEYLDDPTIRGSLNTDFSQYAKANYLSVPYWISGNDIFLFNSPSSGAVIGGTIRVSASAKASNISHVRFILTNNSGYSSLLANITSGFGIIEFWWTTNTVSDGEYILHMNVSRLGGFYNSTSITIFVDNTPGGITSSSVLPTSSSDTTSLNPTEDTTKPTDSITLGFLGISTMVTCFLTLPLIHMKRKEKR